MKKSVKLLNVVIVPVLLFCIVLLPVYSRRLFVSFAEKILGEELYREFWTLFLFNMAITGILICIIIFGVVNTKKGRKIYTDCRNEWATVFKSFFTKENLLLFLIILTIYFVGIFTIIRSNSYYNDDIDRSLKGYRGWAVWGRYLADFLSVLIHMNLKLNDISPLPQIISISFMAAATLVVLRSLSEKKITFPLVIALLPIGLSPYFMENYSYKYDSPYMALSVLFSVIPFLFYKKISIYIIASFLCLLGMCISYQSSSGIYVIVTALVTYRMWIGKITPAKDILKFVTSSILSYSAALVFFKKLLFVTIKSEETGYYRTAMFSFSDLFKGIILNGKKYVNFVFDDFNGSIIPICFFLLVIIFIILSILFSKRSKIITFLFSLFFGVFIFILSYGAYLVLQEPLWSPRAFTGFGGFVAVICFLNVSFSSEYKKLKYVVTVLLLVLVYNFFLFDVSYGNALAEQKEYQNFRTALLVEDINRHLGPGIVSPIVHMENNIGFSPVIDNISSTYPLIKRIINVLPGGSNEWGHLPLNQFKFSHKVEYDSPVYNSESPKLLPILTDNSYHTIHGDGRQFFIILKN
jgi:hypothetical protein